MTAPAETPAAPITEKDLEGLPPRAMVALAARAAWRVLPATRLLPAVGMNDVAAAVALASMASLRGGTLPAVNVVVDAVTAISYATEDPAASNAAGVAERAAHAAGSFSSDEDVVESLNLAADVFFTVQSEPQVMEIAADAARSDLDWLREWSSQKRAADGIIGPDFFHRPLWQRSDGESPPDEWLRIIDDWIKTAYSAGLVWLVEQHERLLKGGDLDVQRQQAFLDDWYTAHQQRASAASEDVANDAGEASAKQSKIGIASKNKDFFGTLGDTGQKVQPDQEAEQAQVPKEELAASVGAGPYEPEPAPGPDPEPSELLPTGIVTAAADIPATEDHLGRTPLVETLADMLASPAQALPMTIALLGDWGAGKSSVIAQLRERLDELALKDRLRAASTGEHRYNQYKYAEFNAWEYEQTKSLRAGLAQEVVNGLTADLEWWSRRWLALNKARKGNSWEFWKTVAGLFLATLGLWLGYDLATPEKASTGEVLSGGGVAAVSAYILLQTWRTGRRLLEHPLVSQLSTYLKLPSYGEHLGEVPVIKKDISELCAERLGEITNGRLLVIVDDLDRCHPSAVIETLDAIRLVMNLENVAVILAIDDRIAFRAVADHYKQLAEDGKRSKEEIARDYLGKIIQLPVNLYQPWPQEVDGFIREFLFQVEEEETETGISSEEDEKETEQQEIKAAGSEVDATQGAREFAKQHNINLTLISGTGQDGRIIKKDVETYRKNNTPAVDAETATTASEISSATQTEATTETVDTEITQQDFSDATQQEEAHTKAREALMKDSAFERNLFAELAKEMAFHNPRQLIRLRNSYRLLKGYRHSREKRPVDTKWVKFLMHGLFWYEFLYQQKLSDRQLAELVAWEWSDKDWEQDARQKDEEEKKKREALEAADDKRAEQLANPPVVNMSRRLNKLLPKEKWTDGYPGLMQTVEMVVLPNAQMGLLLKRHDVDEVLYGKSTSVEGAKLDPWNLALARPEQKPASGNSSDSSGD